ncbi:hypothetical protein HY357_02825 [Candidatus Roizmanbacteria bacterium]|nr:hypothetical protein [Candidatus Roizmanbacteria bacterium]
MSKTLTQKEFARMGAETTNAKYPADKRRQWAKKGPQALKDKYGNDYFIKRAEKMREVKKQKREQKLQIEANLGY